MVQSLPAKLLRIGQPVMLLVALLFITLLVQSQWQELTTFPWSVRPAGLALSGVLLLLAGLLEVAVWRHILGLLRGRLSWSAALRIWYTTSLVRYIPGNIWQPLGMTVLCRRQNVPPEATILSVALYQAVNLLAVLPIAALYLAATGNLGLLSQGFDPDLLWSVPVILGPLLLFLARPDLFLALLNRTLRRLGRQTLDTALTRRQLAVLLLLALADWALWAAGFCALVLSLLPDFAEAGPGLLLHLLAVYPMAYALGYLSFLTPSGLAVREGVLLFFLTPVIGLPQATLSAIAMRIWQVALEVAMAAVVLLSVPKMPALPGDDPA